MEKGQGSYFDYNSVIKMLDELNADESKVNIQKFHDLCKSLTKLSGSLGKLISWGFEDIHSKCSLLMSRWKDHPECNSLHEIIEKEMGLKIHLLNSYNNEKMGFKKGDKYDKYESGILPSFTK